MPKSSVNASLSSYDDIFSTEESRQEEQREQVRQIPIGELFPFKNHPFKVLDDDSMSDTVESVKQYGVLSPLIARPRPKGGYEIISGHRRQHAAELAGLETLPVIVREMSDDAAVILMVDSNLQREHILPSERAFAYKMKLDLFSCSGDNGDLIYIMMQAEGVAEFKDGEPYITENETMHRVCETIVDMAKKNVCYLANSWSDYIDQSIQGDMVAGVVQGNWIIPTMEAVTENSGKWQITTIPTLDGGEGYASNGGSGLYITANCGNVDLAKSFLAYTFGGSTQTYDNALRDGGVVTTVLKCADSDVYNEGVEFFNNEPVYKQIVEMSENVPIIEQSDYHVRAGVYLTTAVINTINGSNLDDELANAEQQLRFEMGL